MSDAIKRDNTLISTQLLEKLVVGGELSSERLQRHVSAAVTGFAQLPKDKLPLAWQKHAGKSFRAVSGNAGRDPKLRKAIANLETTFPNKEDRKEEFYVRLAQTVEGREHY